MSSPSHLHIEWASIYAALPDTAGSANCHACQVVHIAPVSLTVEGADKVRRLKLMAELYLQRHGQVNPDRLRVSLFSDAWTHSAVLPPVQHRVDLTPTLAGKAEAALAFTLSEAELRKADGQPAWLQFLQPARAVVAAGDDEGSELPLEESLPQALTHWLKAYLRIVTVGDAVRVARNGPLGHFGPLESLVLERTGQADLAIEATCLAEADNAQERDGDATATLRLFGERFGRWLLHRRVCRPVKASNKGAASREVATCEVLIAETAAELVQLAGLAALEKRLFKLAGILPDATLWQDAALQDTAQVSGAEEGLEGLEGPEGQEGHKSAATEAGTPQHLDISAVPDRSRRRLHNLVALAQQGKLNAADLDLLYRLARQLSRPNR